MSSPNANQNTPNDVKNNTPTMYFKLTPLTSNEIFEQIQRLTNNFDENLHLSADFVSELRDNLNTNNNSLFRGFLNTPKNDDGSIMKQVIGKEGCYFHMTTQNTKSMFIWHDRNNYKVYVWGEKFPVINSLKIVQQRIKTVIQRSGS